MHVAVPSTKASLKDRFIAAYYAFRMTTRPDMEAAMNAFAEIEARHQADREAQEEKLRTAVDRLDGFDKALVTSIAAGTANWRQLLGQVMPTIQRLDIEDQIGVVRHIVKNNSQAASDLTVRNWMQSNVRTVLAHLPE